ncbi:MAG TPA: sigma-70 family RNA polymerase sigma factor, partial [Lacipirellulaceae bacterium]|nr:sigma-70 family RNA polymerase sigma factor [Lacipirellulaceae bacterium]
MQTLAARLVGGEDSAFPDLYDACADRLFRYAAVRLGSAEAARDVVQTVFLRAVKNRRRFRGVENPTAYVFAMARNETARAAGRRARQSEFELPTEDSWQAGAASPSGDDAEAAAAALGRLAAEDREIVELKIFAGLTFAEI